MAVGTTRDEGTQSAWAEHGASDTPIDEALTPAGFVSWAVREWGATAGAELGRLYLEGNESSFRNGSTQSPAW